jgi:aldose 1-epimerase
MTAPSTIADDTAFELHAGALRLAVRPDLGGSIAGLWHRDTPILRSTEPAELKNARLSGCFPLVPYSNRLAYRKFRWKGRDYTTQPNFGDSPHSVHGVGWMKPWEVGNHTAIDVELKLEHAGDAHWPFAFEAVQHFSLTPQSLVAQMIITNTADIAQPVGLGWHPYFPKRAAHRVERPLGFRRRAPARAPRLAAGHRCRRVASRLRQRIRRLERPGAHP